ncbi:MAG: sigma-70 family RNA polymerase sigma factor [Verrucomicrobiota bacterium]
MASNIYRKHTGDATPSQQVIEDVVSLVVVDFLTKNRFDAERGRLRTYLRVLTNARVVDLLRKERPFDHLSLEDCDDQAFSETPAETPDERKSFSQALLATLIEDMKEQIPLRHFEIFEMVKLKEMPPSQVAEELGVDRRVVDNTVYKVMKRLREIGSRPEYQEEYYD